MANKNSRDGVKELIDNDPNYIAIKRFDFSLKNLLERYPEGVPTRIICQALQMTEEEVEALYQSVLEKLKTKIAS
jgi:hypothetical protein